MRLFLPLFGKFLQGICDHDLRNVTWNAGFLKEICGNAEKEFMQIWDQIIWFVQLADQVDQLYKTNSSLAAANHNSVTEKEDDWG